MTEAAFQSKLLKELKTWGKFYKITDRIRCGIPDIVGCRNGKFVAIEVKNANNKSTALQAYEQDELRKRGALVAVITCKKDIILVEDGTETHQTDKLKDAIEWLFGQLFFNIK